MSEADHKYTPPEDSSRTLPAAVTHYLDGANLLEKTQALRLSTIDAEGWPHAALLSAGDALAMPSGNIRFVLFPQSGTVANLARDGRADAHAFARGWHVRVAIARPSAETLL
jgi:hypothetical protein